jgi:hypothetical protein
MQKLFTRILVPVAFNRNTRWSVDKAVQLANKFRCDVLLVHARVPALGFPNLYNAFFKTAITGYPEKKLYDKMKLLEKHYRYKLREGLLMSSVIYAGCWQSVLKDVIVSGHIDLTLIPRNKRPLRSVILRRIDVNLLSRQTNCPIMTITRSFNVQRLENVVVPVHDLLPVKKLLVAHYLSLETGCKIYLVGADNAGVRETGGSYLTKAYRLLGDFGKPVVHCVLREDIDIAEMTLKYARGVRASLIVVNPAQESRSRGWWNRLRGNYLCRQSDIPVMTVAV